MSMILSLLLGMNFTKSELHMLKKFKMWKIVFAKNSSNNINFNSNFCIKV